MLHLTRKGALKVLDHLRGARGNPLLYDSIHRDVPRFAWEHLPRPPRGVCGRHMHGSSPMTTDPKQPAANHTTLEVEIRAVVHATMPHAPRPTPHAQLLRQARLAMGWSPRTLASRVGCTPSLIGEMERGARSPTPTMVRALARALPKLTTRIQELALPTDTGSTLATPERVSVRFSSVMS